MIIEFIKVLLVADLKMDNFSVVDFSFGISIENSWLYPKSAKTANISTVEKTKM